MKLFARFFVLTGLILLITSHTFAQYFGKNYTITELSYSYDSIEFLAKKPDYSKWKNVPPDSLKKYGDTTGIKFNLPDFKLFNGYGRIRFKLYCDSLAISKLWEIEVQAPYELYLNGKLVFSNGVVSTDIRKEEIFYLKTVLNYEFINKIDTNIVELRFSLLRKLEKNSKENYSSKVEFKLNPEKGDLMSDKMELVKSRIELAWYAMFFFTLFVIFLLIFLMYRKFINYLYFSLLNLFISMVVSPNTFEYYFSTNIFSHYLNSFFSIGMVSLMLFLPINMFFTEKKKLKRAIYVLISLLFFATFILKYLLTSKFVNILGYCLVVILISTFIFATIVTIMAIRKKKPGAKIIGIGLLLPVATILLFILLTLIFQLFLHIEFGNKYGLFIILALAVSFMCIPVSMAIYLAREMAMNIVSLEKQIIEIHRLSEENISREKEKQKMIAEQNILLEQQVKERTAEIEQQKEEILAQSEEIATQRDALSNKKNEIISSIQYAQRIQNAVLQNNESFKQYFAEYFILFKPRDIVSGDFYWLRKVKNYVLLATADCTGHGVPGAFMSILGISLLNEIVSKNLVESAGEILNNLRRKIKTILHQQGFDTDQKDGMDIAICMYDFDNMTMQYAGAYNSIYLVRQKKNLPSTEKTTDINIADLIEYKADKQPCAVHILESDFATQNILLQKGDIIYTFSDGFSDQRGGIKNKKYLSKNFRNYLLQICSEPLEKQKDLLELNIENWKNNREQIDDITVVGVKI